MSVRSAARGLMPPLWPLAPSGYRERLAGLCWVMAVLHSPLHAAGRTHFQVGKAGFEAQSQWVLRLCELGRMVPCFALPACQGRAVQTSDVWKGPG